MTRSRVGSMTPRIDGRTSSRSAARGRGARRNSLRKKKAESWSDFNRHGFKNKADPDGICGCESQSASMGLGKRRSARGCPGAGREQHARDDRADADRVVEVQALAEEEDREQRAE